MDGTSGFAVSNRSIHPLIRDSDCSWGLFIGTLKNAAIKGISHVTIYISATSGRSTKWMAPADSQRRIGVTALLNDILMAVGGTLSVG